MPGRGELLLPLLISLEDSGVGSSYLTHADVYHLQNGIGSRTACLRLPILEELGLQVALSDSVDSIGLARLGCKSKAELART